VEGAVWHIERVLGDANADVRKCAAEALGEIGGRESLPLLVRLKKDANPYVRQAAQEGLKKASGIRFV
jgi:HEAT repeat protein